MGVTQQLAAPSTIMTEMGIYWIISMVFFTVMDVYAAKKIGGRRMLGYKVLRPPKFLAMSFCSVYTLVLYILCLVKDLSVTREVLTYFGVPFFVAWVFFLTTVLRRVRAETKGRQY